MTRLSVAKWLSIAALFTTGLAGCGAPSEPSPEKVEIGTAYSYKMYTHCGAREAKFASEYWEAVNTDARRNNSPSGWDDPYQKGTMTRLSETAAVFEADGREKRYLLRPGATTFQQVCS
ncbi:hypothetical protein [Rhodococcus sp. WS3]|uniref:hypothetical protein n=1 Tax=Rhodococcus sp. WS3 TaxID=2486271 RepID=UPI001143ADB2|nr:hypothetical protein [Rhodococcus sp. WS3]